MEGSGTYIDPYLVVTEEDLRAMANDIYAYYTLMADIDLTDIWAPLTLYGVLDGRGNTVSGITVDDTAGSDHCGFFSNLLGAAKVLNLNLVTTEIGIQGSADKYSAILAGYTNGAVEITRVSVLGHVDIGGYRGGGLIGYSGGLAIVRETATFATVTSGGNSSGVVGGAVSGQQYTQQFGVWSSSYSGKSSAGNLFNGSDLSPPQISDPSNYPGYFDFDDFWEIVDGFPRVRKLYVIPTGNTQTSKVSGVVQIDGSPAKRTVRAFSYNSVSHLIEDQTVLASKSLGQSSSAADTGAYSIDLLFGYGSEIFVVAFDDYGAKFVGGTSLNVGDRIHPTTPNGYVFECVSSGALPEEEPVWIIDTETSQLYGTASIIARPFYRPMVHGPVMPEVTAGSNLWTPALITNLVWLDSSDSSTLTTDVDGRVSRWADKSGNEFNFTQALEARQPYYQDGIFFSEDYLSRDDLANIKFVMLVVNRVDQSPSQNYPKVLPLLGQEGTSQHHLFMQVDSAYDFSIDGAGGYSGDIYLNGEDPVAGTNIELGLSDDFMFETNLYAIEWDEAQEFGTIGRFATPSDAYYLTGAVLEVLMFTETPSSQQMRTLEGYLAHKWNMAEKLPAGHPYKGAAPVISPAWTPASLFLNAEAGAWYDPSDLTTMFQDLAGTVPVTSDGDPVALLLDKSGNAHHATQNTDSNRPVYRTDGTIHWLESSGAGEWLISDSLLSNPWSVLYRAQSLDLSANSTIFSQRIGASDPARTLFYLGREAQKGGLLQIGGSFSGPGDVNSLDPVTYAWDRDGAEVTLTRDGVEVYEGASFPEGDSSSGGMSLLSTSEFHSSIRLYGAIFVDHALLSNGDQERATDYLESKAP